MQELEACVRVCPRRLCHFEIVSEDLCQLLATRQPTIINNSESRRNLTFQLRPCNEIWHHRSQALTTGMACHINASVSELTMSPCSTAAYLLLCGSCLAPVSLTMIKASSCLPARELHQTALHQSTCGAKQPHNTIRRRRFCEKLRTAPSSSVAMPSLCTGALSPSAG